MAKKQYSPADYRAILERNAQFDHNSRVVLNLRRSREAGLARQKTVEEIAADMEAARGTPPTLVRHESGSVHVASLVNGQPYRCPECQ